MVLVLKPKGFKLPRVEKEKFMLLIHLGLDYNRDQYLYSIKNYNNIEKIVETVEDILKSEVAFLQNCTRCGKDFACSECNYYDFCSTKNLPFSCVCPNCLKDRKHFEEYLEKL